MKKFLVIFTIITFTCSCDKLDFQHYGTHFYENGLSIESTVSAPNSVGGVTPMLKITNNTGKTIKYLHVAGDMRNTFGDNVSCEIRGYTGFGIDITGPIYSGTQVTCVSSNCFYNRTTTTYCINHVGIEYL